MDKMVLISQDEDDLRIVSVLGIFNDITEDKNALDQVKTAFFEANKTLMEDELFDNDDVATMFKFLVSNNMVSNGIYTFKLIGVEGKK